MSMNRTEIIKKVKRTYNEKFLLFLNILILCSLISFFTVLWIRRIELAFFGIYASILNLYVFFISSILSGGPSSIIPVRWSILLYLHCKFIDQFKLFLCIMSTKNCNLAEIMFFFLFKMINKFLPVSGMNTLCTGSVSANLFLTSSENPL